SDDFAPLKANAHLPLPWPRRFGNIGTSTTAARRQPLAGGGLEAVIMGVAHQACSSCKIGERLCGWINSAQSRNLRTRRAGSQYTQPLRIFRVQPPLISQIAKEMLGGSPPFLSAKAGNQGKPAATRSASWAVGGPRCGGGQQSATGRGVG